MARVAVDRFARRVGKCRAVAPTPSSAPSAPVPAAVPGPAPAWHIGTLLFAALWWAFDLFGLRAGIPGLLDDTWEYGLAARSLLEGHGFRTLAIHPPLWTLRDAAGTVPVLVHGPLLPLLIAPLLALFGPHALDHMAWLAALFALLAAAQLYHLAERRFGPAVATAAAALFTISPLTLRAVHHDPALVLGTWLLLLALDLLAQPRPRALAGGLVFGAAILTRPEFLAGALLLPFLRGRAWRTAVGIVAVAAPWWLHMARATGSPWFNLSSYLLIGYHGYHPGLSVLRDFAMTPARWPATLAGSWPIVFAKAVEFLPHALKRALLAPTGATGWLALVGGVVALRDARTRGFTALALALAAIPVAVMTLTVYDSRYLVPFLPLWCLGVATGAQALAGFLPEWGRRPRAWIGLLALIALPSVAPAVKDAEQDARRLEARLSEERGLIARAIETRPTSANEVVFSDTPDFMAWTSGRPTVWMTLEEYGALLPCAADGASPLGDQPCRGESRFTWFHPAGVP